MNKKLISVFGVLGLALIVGFIFLMLNDQGVAAEVVDAQPRFGEEAESIGGVLVCAPAGTRLGSDPDAPEQAYVHILPSTELIDQRRRSPAVVHVDDFQPGQRVRVWTNRRSLLSDPAQLFATRVSIISDPVEGRPSTCNL